MNPTTAAPALRMQGIGKSFPGIRALSDVDLEVRSGEVHAIVGENGAGKSTLMKILAGVHQPDEGFLELSGERVRITGQSDALRRGIGMVYQELNLVPDLTVAENISLGRTPSRFGVVDNRALLRDARRVAPRRTRRADRTLTACRFAHCEPTTDRRDRQSLRNGSRTVVLRRTHVVVERARSAVVVPCVIARMRKSGIAVIYISHRLRAGTRAFGSRDRSARWPSHRDARHRRDDPGRHDPIDGRT